ncbi:MAG: dihydrodipicolinate synthase family protein, partial [Paracoccaceae bacterium]|nr:dihydrodipicolinate synthase family protein [Paracoccaceae bacterium]
ILDHFKEMGDVGIPIMLQDAPLSGVPLPVPLLAELAKNIEMLQLFKIESTGAAEKIHSLLKLADQHIEGPFDGEEGITLYADLEAGATGSMTSALIPDLVRPVITSFLTGSKSTAREQYGAVLPIINHENRQCGFRATKEAMVEGGIIKSSYCRHPIERLRPQARDMLMELLKIHDPAVLSWGK